MKVLIVASYNKQKFAPFIVEQVNALVKAGVECDYFGIEGKGIWGYLGSLGLLRRKIHEYKPGIIHAHYGLSCLLACLQREVPVVSTYHGSDINVPRVLRFSKLAMRLSAFNIFVSEKNVCTAGAKQNYAVIPCGVDLANFQLQSKEEARSALGWGIDEKKVLFAGAFDNAVKNAELAKEAVGMIPNVELIELKGFSRPRISTLMHAADAFLMTSFSEGSPQVIKEAMACGCPIVSVDVGDVKELVNGIDGCYVVPNNAKEIAGYLGKLFSSGRRTEGRTRIIQRGLTNEVIAGRLIEIYKSCSDNETR